MQTMAVEAAPQAPWNWRDHLLDTRHGITFYECLMACASTKELIMEFDRLSGTNLQNKGTPLETVIDQASGKTDSDIEKFIQFVWESTFLRF
jgi:hypothetical protein